MKRRAKLEAGLDLTAEQLQRCGDSTTAALRGLASEVLPAAQRALISSTIADHRSEGESQEQFLKSFELRELLIALNATISAYVVYGQDPLTCLAVRAARADHDPGLMRPCADRLARKLCVAKAVVDEVWAAHGPKTKDGAS